MLTRVCEGVDVKRRSTTEDARVFNESLVKYLTSLNDECESTRQQITALKKKETYLLTERVKHTRDAETAQLSGSCDWRMFTVRQQR